MPDPNFQWSDAAGWLALGVVLGLALLITAPVMARMASRLKIGFHRSVSAEPTVLISNGKVIDHNLEKLGMSESELRSVLRERGLDHPSQALAAIAHADGKVHVVRRSSRTRTLLPPRKLTAARRD